MENNPTVPPILKSVSIPENNLNIVDIAKYQRSILLCLLTNIFVFFLGQIIAGAVYALVFFLLNIVIVVFNVYFTYKIANSLKLKYPILFCFGSVIPFISFIVTIILILKATKILKQAGFRVGLLGADLKEIKSKLV